MPLGRVYLDVESRGLPGPCPTTLCVWRSLPGLAVGERHAPPLPRPVQLLLSDERARLAAADGAARTADGDVRGDLQEQPDDVLLHHARVVGPLTVRPIPRLARQPGEPSGRAVPPRPRCTRATRPPERLASGAFPAALSCLSSACERCPLPPPTPARPAPPYCHRSSPPVLPVEEGGPHAAAAGAHRISSQSRGISGDLG